MRNIIYYSSKVITVVMIALIVFCAFFTDTLFAAEKHIGLVSEDEYYSKYTNANKYRATPYYRYATRSKETTTSGQSYLSGWELDSRTLMSTSTGDWLKGTGPGNSTTSDSYYEYVTTVENKKAYQYYAYVCDHKSWYWLNTGGAHNSGTCKTKNKLTVYVPSSSLSFNKDSDNAYICPASFSVRDPKGFSNVFGVYYKGEYTGKWTSGTDKTYLWKSGDTATYYRKTTKKYQYTYSRLTDWSAWSEWTSARRSTSDYVKEDSQKMYYIIDIEPDVQKITATSSYNKKTGDTEFNLNCSTNGNGTLTYSSNNSQVASVDSKGNVTVKNAGTARITVKASGTSDYYPAEKTITVNVEQRIQKKQTISGQSTYSCEIDDNAFSLGCSTNGDGTLTYSSNNPAVATVNESGMVTVCGAGTAQVVVNATETLDYKQATKKIDITVEKKKQSITGTTTYNKIYGDEEFYLDNATNGDGKITYNSSSPQIVNVGNDGKVSVLGTGTVKITIKASETDNYKSVSKTIKVISKVAPVSEVNAVLQKDNKTVKITWTPVSCDGYEIRYKKNGADEWTTSKVKVNNPDITEAELNVSKFSTGSKYYVSVVGVCDNYTLKSACTGEEKNTDSFRRVSKRTITLKRQSSQKVKISWSKTASADGYYIYRKGAGKAYDKDNEYYAKTTKNYYVDKKAKNNKKYEYWIRAYQINENDEIILGAYSKVKKI